MAKKTVTKSAKKSPPKKPAAKKPAAKPALKKAQKTAPKKTSKPALKKSPKKVSTTNKNIKKMPIKSNTTKTTKTSAAKKPARKAGRVIIDGSYKPNDKEEYMSANQLEYFRQKLLKWKNELSTELKETLDNLKEENWQESDIADRATVETDASLELRTRDRYRKLINKINDALQRIDRGTYGYCEETGEEIGLKRLEARPIATLSIAHYDEDLEERLA
jgi:DnaK suppressor protein